MNKKTLLMLALAAAPLAYASKPIYKDPKKSVDERVDDLMSRMSLQQKVAQMCQYVGPEHIRDTEARFKGRVSKNNDANGFYKTLSVEGLEELTRQGLVGSFLHVVTPEEGNYLQKLAQESELQIPILIGIDAIHGNALCAGATVYPTPIGQAASFDPALVEEASRQTALEMRASGSHWSFTPNIDVARDARWGRIGETFGEDPYLVTQMGIATIDGLQGDNLMGEDVVLACAKHLIAGSEPSNGTNAAPMDISEHTLREVYLPPYKAAVEEANVFTAMAAHNELNGVPCHADKWMMEDILRSEYGFDGFIVSDWMDIERIHSLHHFTPTMKEAYRAAVSAGLDMHMHGPDFMEGVVELVEAGQLPIARVDEACRKILEAKFRLGLFENPYIDVAKAKKMFFNKEHQATALEMAQKAIVLLKNKDLLPLNLKKTGRIFVTGPNANSDAVLGDWVLQQPADRVTTILEGIQDAAGEEQVTFYDLGTDVRRNDLGQVKKAAQAAQGHDLAIVVVGENPLRYQKIKTTGENVDRMSLDLLGHQEQLIQAIHKTGVPTLVILVGGRPLSVNWAQENVPAIIQAFEPGSMAGKAVVQIIEGEVNPSAKLPVSIPRHSGQVQMIYNHKPSQYFHKYKDGPSTPLYPFGYGLSYTTFTISDLDLDNTQINKSQNVEVTCTVTNTGKVAGTEVVQLYIRDQYSSITRPVKELKDFKRVELAPGESKTITFTITPNKLAFYNKKMHLQVEEGDFDVLVGSSSRDQDLQKATFSVL